MFLFMDTETTGTPKDYKAPMTDLDNWPRVIQLAWLLTDKDGNHLNQKEHLIKPDCWVIPSIETHGEKAQFWIDHGFSTEKSKREGIPLRRALVEFLADLEQSEYLICHNMEFDKNILGAELLRYEMRGKKVQKICTMQSSIDFCEIPFAGQRAWLSKQKRSFKWPKLSELHEKLFGKAMEGGHQAGEDVTALKACFFELVKRGVISLQPQPTQP